jgi:hypothetical protein
LEDKYFRIYVETTMAGTILFQTSSSAVGKNFLMGKARVASLKLMSTPRMELTAAVISVNVSSMLPKELNYKETKELYHTDSTVVLGYINNEARRSHTYVGN